MKVTTSNEAATLSSDKNNQLLVEKLDGKCFDNVDSRDKTLPQAKEKENGVYMTSLAKQKSLAKLSHCSRDSLEMKEISKIGGNVSIDKTLLKSKNNLEMGGHNIVGIPDRQINKRLGEGEVYEKEKYGISSAKITSNVKNRRNYDEYDDVKEVPSKKPKIDTMSVKHSEKKLPDRQINKRLGENKAFEKEKYGASSARKTNNVQNRRTYYDNDDDDDDEKEVPSKKPKIDTMHAKLARDKLQKESSTTSLNVEHKLDYRVMEVTQRPDVVSCRTSTLILSC